jgi:glyoxylase-like metal-dependent hydrolase (beta-lactamase superfamily II)
LNAHAYPDHYGGMGEINAAFPDTPILARQGVIDGIPERPAKRLRRQEAYGDQIPDETPVPQPLTGDSYSLEGHIVDFVDLPVAETVHATAFHVPDAQAVIAGDLVGDDHHHHHSHCYVTAPTPEGAGFSSRLRGSTRAQSGPGVDVSGPVQVGVELPALRA